MRREGVLSGGHSHLAYRCSYFASVALALLFAGSLVPYRMTVRRWFVSLGEPLPRCKKMSGATPAPIEWLEIDAISR